MQKPLTQSIPDGYKLTEAGVIPNDWSLFKLVDITNTITCGVAATPEYVDRSKGKPFLSASHVQNGNVVFDNFKYIPVSLFNAITRNNPPKRGDILYTRVGAGIGEAGIVEFSDDFAIYVSLTLIKPKRQINNYFLKEILNSPYYRNLAKRDLFAGAGVQNLNVQVVREFPIPIPPTLDEQLAIAKTLSDLNDIIQKTEKLIAKKRAIKQGAMQDLLTGKLRLPGFSGEWKEKKLEDIADFLKGSGLSKSKINDNGQYKCILYGELFTTYNQVIGNIKSKTNTTEGLLSRKGDVLMPGSTTTIGIDLAKASALLEDNILLGGDIIVIRKKIPNLYNPEFLANYLTHISKYKIAEIAQGITIIHLHGNRLKEISIKIPLDIKEQDKIALILSDMNNEIENLESKLEKYNDIKQGAIQVLLNGKIRLIKN